MAEEKSLRDIIRDEYKKCALDPAYFIRKYIKIQHPQRGTIPFSLYPFQDKTIQLFEKEFYNIILKCRQMGISTLVSAYALWMMLFHSDKNILVLATKQEVAKNLVTKVRFANDNLPSWLKIECVEDNRLSLRFKNGSQIKAVSSAGDTGRSEALSLLIMDEVAFIDDVEKIWLSVQSTLSTGGKAILLSTPNGVGNFFHKTWLDAEEGTNKFKTIRLHWSLHPDRNKAWRDEQTVLLGEHGAAQECDCDFISSGNTVIPLDLIEWYKDTFKRDPKEKRGFDGNYWIWEYPVQGNNYLLCADVGRGDATDYSAFHVIDVETLRQVAEYRGKVETKDYGNMLVAAATEYNTALLVIENANVGWAVIQQVLDRGYSNLFYMSSDLHYVDAEQQMTNRINNMEKKMTPGFTTSLKTRPLLVSKFNDYMREHSVIIQSVRTLEELTTFIWNGSKAEAMSGYNDDLVMSLAIGLWIRDTALRLISDSIAIQKKMMENVGTSKKYEENSIIMPNRTNVADPYKMKLGGGVEEDLRWLLR